MRKPERVKLHKKMRELLSRLGSEVKSFDELSMETVSLPGEYGRISIAFYNARDAKVAPWLPCRLIDWPAEVKYGSLWRGFRHRKQNLYFFDEVTADQAVDAAVEHLRKLGLSRQLAEVVDVAARDMVAELEDAASISNDELGEWWEALTGLHPRILDCASEDFRDAWIEEIKSEHARLKAEFRIETRTDHGREYRELLHEDE